MISTRVPAYRASDPGSPLSDQRPGRSAPHAGRLSFSGQGGRASFSTQSDHVTAPTYPRIGTARELIDARRDDASCEPRRRPQPAFDTSGVRWYSKAAARGPAGALRAAARCPHRSAPARGSLRNSEQMVVAHLLAVPCCLRLARGQNLPASARPAPLLNTCVIVTFPSAAVKKLSPHGPSASGRARGSSDPWRRRRRSASIA